MFLGDLIKKYRSANNLSLRDFAKRCGLSHTYISALEKNIDPRTGKPIAPTLDTVKYVSKGMNISIEEILKALDIAEEDEISMCELFDQYTRRGISRGIIIMCKDFNATYEDTLQKLKNKLNISEKEAEEQMKLYW